MKPRDNGIRNQNSKKEYMDKTFRYINKVSKFVSLIRFTIPKRQMTMSRGGNS